MLIVKLAHHNGKQVFSFLATGKNSLKKIFGTNIISQPLPLRIVGINTAQKNYLKPGVIWHKTFLHKWRKLYAAPKLEKNTNNQQQLKQEIHTTTANAKFRPILQHKLLLGRHEKQMGRE